MPNQHIFVEENEIRITDDSGGPASHIVRHRVLDRDNYWYLPLLVNVAGSTRINEQSLESTGLSVSVEKGAKYLVDVFISALRTNGAVTPYIQLTAPTGSTGYTTVHQPQASQWSGVAINSEYTATNFGTGTQNLFLRGWLVAGDDGTLDVQMRINGTDAGTSDFYDILSSSFMIIDRMA